MKKSKVWGCRAFSRCIEIRGDERIEMSPSGASLIISSIGGVLSRIRKRIPVSCNEIDARRIERSEVKQKVPAICRISWEVHVHESNGMAGDQSSNLEQSAIMRRLKRYKVRTTSPQNAKVVGPASRSPPHRGPEGVVVGGRV